MMMMMMMMNICELDGQTKIRKYFMELLLPIARLCPTRSARICHGANSSSGGAHPGTKSSVSRAHRAAPAD